MPKKKKDEPKLREAKIVSTPDGFQSDSDIEGIGDDSMLLPNQGEEFDDDRPEKPEAEQEELAEDKEVFGGDPAIINAVFEWLDNEIADCDSVEATMALAKAEDVSIDVAMQAMNLTRKVFTAKRVSFQNIRDTLKEDQG